MSNKSRLWATYCDGEFEITSLERKDHKEAIGDAFECFFHKESVCIATEMNLPQNQLARDEIRKLCAIACDDNVSLVARHIPTNKIVAVVFNKIQRVSGDESFFKLYRDNCCKSPNAKTLMNYMIEMEEKIDVFELYNLNCVFELMMLSVMPNFRRRGLGNILIKYSVELAKELKQKKDGPQAVVALCTSSTPQKICKSMGCKPINRVPFSKFFFDEKAYSDRIGPQEPFGEHLILLLE